MDRFGVLGMSGVVQAHTSEQPHMDFTTGLAHPLSGLDHILAMVAVGLWATQLGGRALWVRQGQQAALVQQVSRLVAKFLSGSNLEKQY
jgi:hydrogenase/urease accessory protein HupE